MNLKPVKFRQDFEWMGIEKFNNISWSCPWQKCQHLLSHLEIINVNKNNVISTNFYTKGNIIYKKNYNK